MEGIPLSYHFFLAIDEGLARLSFLYTMEDSFCKHWQHFISFGKKKYSIISNLFIHEYRDEVSAWKEMKEVFSVKLQKETFAFA